MAFSSPTAFLTGAKASADLSANKYQPVVVDAAGEVAVAGVGVLPVGVLLNDPSAQGRACEVMTVGVAPCKAGAAFAAGARLAVDAAGKAVLATTGAYTFGVALQAAGAADEVVSVALQSAGPLA